MLFSSEKSEYAAPELSVMHISESAVLCDSYSTPDVNEEDLIL